MIDSTSVNALSNLYGLNLGFLSFVIVAGFVVLYFTPWLVAATRNHPNKHAILVLSFFAGWTGVGWLVALVWSFLTFPQTQAAPVAAARSAGPFCGECGNPRGASMYCPECGARATA